MKRPPFLKAGDTIGIAATARKVSPEEIQPTIETFQRWGLKVKLSPTLFEAEHQFGGSDEQRATGFQQLLDDAEVRAIICARGGYGSVRMIDRLDFSAFAADPKWIIGFSDITVFHSHLHTHFGIETLHAPMAFSLTPERYEPQSVEGLRQILFGNPLSYSIPANNCRPGKASGQLVGGNLSVLYSLMNSPSDLDTSGKILFLEDLDEYLYHIDRMMMNLKRAGMLEKLAGLVVGGMNDMRDNTIPFGKTATEIITEHVSGYNYPVCFGFPAGHEKVNLSLVFGASHTLTVKENSLQLVMD